MKFEKCAKCVNRILPDWFLTCSECGQDGRDPFHNEIKDNFLLDVTAEMVNEPPVQRASADCDNCECKCRCCIHCFDEMDACWDIGCSAGSAFERDKIIKFCFITGKKVEEK